VVEKEEKQMLRVMVNHLLEIDGEENGSAVGIGVAVKGYPLRKKSNPGQELLLVQLERWMEEGP